MTRRGPTIPRPLRRMAELRPLAQLCRRAILQVLKGLHTGCVTIREGELETVFGDTASVDRAVIDVAHPVFWVATALTGSVGAGETWVVRAWDCEDLPGLLRIFELNYDVFGAIDTGRLAGIGHALRRLQLRLRAGPAGPREPGDNRRNIKAHYDLSNSFFQLFLDPTMTYSCGVFDNGTRDMEEASKAKLRLVCDKLQLGPGQQVLEIGTGWGSFAIHAAVEHGCRVTTTTISDQQADYARAHVHRLGLSDRVTVLRKDYRELDGTFDKVVSIEMIEAIGAAWYERYFQECSARLRPGGLMLLQSITLPDRDMARYRRQVDFIRKHIFPGAQLPSVGALTVATRGSRLRPVHLEEIGEHYVPTLMSWRGQLLANREQAQELGFDDGFLRMWDFYFCSCAAGFGAYALGDVQIVYRRDT